MLNDFAIAGGTLSGIEIFNFLLFENFASMVTLTKAAMIARNIPVELVISWVKRRQPQKLYRQPTLNVKMPVLKQHKQLQR